MRTRRDVNERFDEKVDRSAETGCWLWRGALAGRGYGYFNIAASEPLAYAHRFAFERAFGRIPAGMCVCHRCDNPKCVRPDHLFVGSHSDNMRDMWSKGRHPGFGPIEKRRTRGPARRRA